MTHKKDVNKIRFNMGRLLRCFVCVLVCVSSESYILLNPQSHKLIKVMTLKVISIDLPLMMLYGKETSGEWTKKMEKLLSPPPR